MMGVQKRPAMAGGKLAMIVMMTAMLASTGGRESLVAASFLLPPPLSPPPPPPALVQRSPPELLMRLRGGSIFNSPGAGGISESAMTAEEAGDFFREFGSGPQNCDLSGTAADAQPSQPMNTSDMLGELKVGGRCRVVGCGCGTCGDSLA